MRFPGLVAGLLSNALAVGDRLYASSGSGASRGNPSPEEFVRDPTRDRALGLTRAGACHSVSQPRELAGALPQTADMSRGAGSIADCVRENVRFCTPATDGAPVQRCDPFSHSAGQGCWWNALALARRPMVRHNRRHAQSRARPVSTDCPRLETGRGHPGETDDTSPSRIGEGKAEAEAPQAVGRRAVLID
jgi:hypothetical protein